ncbi:PREDICTED: T-cell surface glycoprotein CD3 delta chain isoform X2 [Chrysochloris asiatica]|uniref:T-cell surface glycoprotein CD3 delta chain n=1 Tax=Chrysochloris asiatica TaxID=185453 RepID=A0A9B0SZG3_CHRAS|nr:PREDICTED: T-cell surface glycoprotein CD3 delta chain isoform X2 [Chrysochloris asiatica]
MEQSKFLVGLILATLLLQVSFCKINVEEHEDKVILTCGNNITWIEGTKGNPISDNKHLDLGKRILDPQGMYKCNGTGDEAGKEYSVEVYYRTADTQTLVRNDQLYQPLRDRDDAHFSHIGRNWPQNK